MERSLKNPQTVEEALEVAKDVINRIDKGNADIYRVPVSKSLDLTVKGNQKLAPTESGCWIFTFRRRLPEHKMFFVWDYESVEE